MIRALLRKEVRQLLPVIVALGALMAWTILDALVLTPPDAQSFARHSWLLVTPPGSGGFEAFAELVIGLVIAYSLLPGEHTQKTIDFLYTLPVRRRTLFLAKYLVGVGVQMGADLIGTGLLFLRHALNHDSFERGIVQPSFVLWTLAGDLLLPFVYVAYGLLLAYFRRLGWLLFALIWTALEVAERVAPPWRILNVKALMTVQYDGLRPIIDTRAWALHGAMAAVALLLAGRLWMGRQERFIAFYDGLRQSRWLRRSIIAVVVGALALSLGGLMSGLQKPVVPAADAPAPAHVVAFDTQHFHFTYRAADAARARLVIRDADQAYDDIRRWLGAPDVDRIIVDMTETSDEHLGIAGWTKMRLALARPMSDALLRHVLYHETTHVFAAALSAGMDNARNNDTRFFAEGLAEYVAYELAQGTPDERTRQRQVAALAHRQFHLRFEDLLAPTVFLRRHDEFLLYALGELYTDALFATCGKASPAQLLRTFADPATPQKLEGFDLWRYALQAQRCDVDRVVGAFEARLRRLEPSAAEVIPVATAVLRGRDDEALLFDVSVTANAAAGPGPWKVAVRARRDADAPPAALVIVDAQVSAGKSTPVRVPLPPGTGPRVEFQVGARFGVRSAFFTRWQGSIVPD